MDMPTQTALAETSFARANKAAKSSRKTYLYLFTGWLLLIAVGMLAAMLYTNHLKQQIASEIAQQTKLQLQAIQQDYQKQVAELKDGVTADMGQLQSKVDSLNELLAFTKDSANSKTDNSNQLYTQLEDVKKKLDELQKNLDVLK